MMCETEGYTAPVNLRMTVTNITPNMQGYSDGNIIVNVVYASDEEE